MSSHQPEAQAKDSSESPRSQYFPSLARQAGVNTAAGSASAEHRAISWYNLSKRGTDHGYRHHQEELGSKDPRRVRRSSLHSQHADHRLGPSEFPPLGRDGRADSGEHRGAHSR